MVKHINEDGLRIESGKGADSIAAQTVVWAGGITASPLGRILARRTNAETEKGGRVKVKPDLTIPNYARRTICGDCDTAKGERPAGAPPVHYFDKGSLAVIGRAAPLADVFGAHLSGFIRWLVWVFIHLMYLVTFQSRVLVFMQWAIQDLTFSRGARSITGAAPTDFNFTKELSEVRAAREIKPEPVNVPRQLCDSDPTRGRSLKAALDGRRVRICP
jgi:NADH:ubiquinone reductase (H+-translocating)